MMRVLVCLFAFVSMPVFAGLAQEPAHGFHWYTRERLEKSVETNLPLPSTPLPTPYEKLMAKRMETLNKLAQALNEPSFEATHEYMKAQQDYAKKNQKFVRHWQQVLMVHPELDNTLNFPTDNSAIAIRNDSMNLLVEKVLNEGAKKYGLIFFYRGESSISQKFAAILMPFVNEHHFSMIAVTTDGQPISGLPNPKSVSLEAVQKILDLDARYMPALFLVNLSTNKMSPLSYGFVSLMELKERFLDVATDYKRFTYEGLGE